MQRFNVEGLVHLFIVSLCLGDDALDRARIPVRFANATRPVPIELAARAARCLAALYRNDVPCNGIKKATEPTHAIFKAVEAPLIC